jgi:hypothetical protein
MMQQIRITDQASLSRRIITDVLSLITTNTTIITIITIITTNYFTHHNHRNRIYQPDFYSLPSS